MRYSRFSILFILLTFISTTHAEVYRSSKGLVFRDGIRIRQRAMFVYYKGDVLKSYLTGDYSVSYENVSINDELFFNSNEKLLTPADRRNNMFNFYYKVAGIYSDWGFLKVDFGLCLGFTVALRRFHNLARFTGVEDDYSLNAAEITLIKNKIDKVLMEGEVVEFERFKNLNSLSKHPEIELYLKRHIAELWIYNNMNRKSIEILINNNPDTLKEFSTNIKLIKELLGLGLEPIILYREDRKRSSIHAVRVVKVLNEDKDEALLRAYDPSGYFLKLLYAPKKKDSIFSIVILPREKESAQKYQYELMKHY